MATFAIGDVQGCFRTLERLLEHMPYSPARDRLVLVGDLVNRGPYSAEVLRWAMRQNHRVAAVLGNHDLHLIACHFGVEELKASDTLDEILEAPDREPMVDWLRARPLAHREAGHLIVHAGLLPSWSVAGAERYAGEVARVLSGDDPAPLLSRMRARPGRRWERSLSGLERQRVILQALTQLRICLRDGAPDYDFSGTLDDVPGGAFPWFEHPRRASRKHTVVFGHWAALGLHFTPKAVCIDTGVGWGRKLTALRLEDRAIFSQPTIDPLRE